MLVSVTRTRSVQTMPSSGPSRQISDGRATCMAQLECYTAQDAIRLTLQASRIYLPPPPALVLPGRSRQEDREPPCPIILVSSISYTLSNHLFLTVLIHDRAVSDPALVLTSKIKRRQSLQLPSTTTSEIHRAGRHGGNGGTSSPP